LQHKKRSPLTITIPFGTVELTNRIPGVFNGEEYRVNVARIPVAVAIFPGDAARGAAAIARFVEESKRVDELHHPGIPVCFGHGIASDGRLFAAFADVDGATLAEGMARGPVALPEGLRILNKLLEIVSLAHQRGVLHRAITPSNVRLSEGGDVYLLAFGRAKLLEELPGVANATAVGVPLGAPGFLAPEQVFRSDAGPATDLFGLAITRAASLAGRPLRSAASAVDAVREAAAPLPPLASFGVDLPPPVAAVFARALAFESGDRFESADEMRPDRRRPRWRHRRRNARRCRGRRTSACGRRPDR
jgi:serine/threonine-protein kinase